MLSPISERRGNTAPDVLRTRARASQAWCRVAACACLVLGFGSAPPVSADESADEGDGTIDFPVDRTGEPDGEATVRYTTCPTPLKDDAAATAACTGFVGTAVAGVDYTATSGTVTFADGEADPVNVPVAIIDDRIDEVDETFYFVIFAPVNLDIPTGKGDAVGTIRDDDPAPVLSVDSPEVGEDEGPLVFSLTLDRPSARLLEVPWRTRPGTAQAGEDYTHVSGVMVFAPDNTAGKVVVPLTDDEVAEDDETLILEVDAIPNLKISGAGAFPGVIEDDDTPDEDPRSAPGRLRSEVKMLVLTKPGQSTETPILRAASSARIVSDRPTTATLLQTTCTLPNARSVSSAARAIASRSVTSTRSAITSALLGAKYACACSRAWSSMSAIATFMPAAQNDRAMARPMPLAPPVTKATLPATCRTWAPPWPKLDGITSKCPPLGNSARI